MRDRTCRMTGYTFTCILKHHDSPRMGRGYQVVRWQPTIDTLLGFPARFAPLTSASAAPIRPMVPPAHLIPTCITADKRQVVALHLFGVHEAICRAAVSMGKGTLHMSHCSSICTYADDTQITVTDITYVTDTWNSSVSTRSLAASYVLQL